ncbi:MAG: vWA domain-containing protein, partial [Anaerolineae bacterium]
MKRRLFWIIVCLTLVLTILPYSGKAQGSGPVVDILGKPDTRSDPPNAKASISVIDRTTGRLVEGLSDANFSVEISDEPVQATATVDTTGLAVVFVIDRGGIARRGSPRIGWAVDLTDNLLSMLTLDGSPTSDMAALIGIRGAEQGGLTPTVPFTDFDPNLIRNEFDALRTEVVDEVTPLYDGVDKAIEWIVENPDPQIQDKLVHHRPVIVVFSDGIDREFSSEAHETLIVNQCQENDILLYAVHIGGGSSDPGNMEALATQTNGVFVSYTPETQEETQTLFQDIVTQRQSYQVTFPLLRPLGDYDARIRVVDTPIGAGSDTATVSSRLQPPRITIIPPPDTTVTVPYSKTLEGFVRTTIPLSTQIEPT